MLPLIAFLLGAQVPIDQPPRLRTVLPNGAVVLVEHVPHAKSLVIDLFVSSRGNEETAATQGRRHLVEHLVALGSDGKLDNRLETGGGFLTARTMRECTEFDLSLPPDGLKLGLTALKSLLTLPTFDADGIAREAATIEQEDALRSEETRASATAWFAAYGAEGLEPLGNMDVIKSTTPDDLAKLYKREFVSNHLAVVVSGDVDLDAATQTLKNALSFVPSGPTDAVQTGTPPQTGSAPCDVHGQYRALPVHGFRSVEAAAALAAALALSSEVPGSEVIYTPSSRTGMVIVGSPAGKMDDVFRKVNAAQMFAYGRAAASRWVDNSMAEQEGAASFRGMLLVGERDLKPETMLENLASLPFAEFKRAFDAFKGNCVIVEGNE